MESLVLSNRQCIDLTCGDVISDVRLISDTIDGTGRWEVHYELIVERISDGTFWSGLYSRGATEYQDTAGYDDDTIRFKQVVPRERMVTVYEPI